jgi:osmoprotectant transport system substrate-binding protein
VRPRHASLPLVLVLVAALLGVAACSPAANGSASPATTIRFASYDFPENQTLVEVYAEAARRRGLPVSIQQGIGTREVVAPALQQGVVDVVVDYVGTALQFARPTDSDLPREPEQMYTVLRRTLGGRGVDVLQPAAGAQDQNGFAVTKAFAADRRVSSLSDLRPLAPRLSFGGPPECPDRPLCLPGLEETYGLRFAHEVPMPSRVATVEALVTGQIDVGLLETTDARLATAPVVLLRDDRGLQPPENVVPMVGTAALDRWGDDLRTALDEVSARLTTADLVRLNGLVEKGMTPAEAAAKWWDAR